MARLCKEGGFIINSMTKQYADFVEEYKNIDKYVEELEDEDTWQIMFRRILQNYTKGNQGLVHGMRINKKKTKGPIAGETEEITRKGEDLVEQAKKRMSTKEGATTEIWKEMVYDKDISNEKVNAAYSVWAEAYDKDFAIVHPDRAKHMADFLLELVEGAGMRKEDLTILDVAAGTGLVGEELKKVGFSVDNVTALDLCPDMLEVSRKKRVYGKLVLAPFGTTMPEGMVARSYDCVLMCGGFAAGHVPLASLHTMARLCKEGGFLINSMTKQYADFVDEYKNIDRYIEELEEEGTWKIMFRRILENYTKGNQGLVHGMRINEKKTRGPVAGEPEEIVVSGEDLVEQAKKRMSTKEGPTTEIWKEMVYDKDISNDKVNAAYSVWAEAYDKDFAIVHPNRAQHMADFLLELVEGAGMRKEDLT